MALFDFEIISSGMNLERIPEPHGVEDSVIIYIRFTDLFGSTGHQAFLHLNSQILNSGLHSVRVGGMATGGSIQHIGIVISSHRPSKTAVVDVNGDQYDCRFRADEKIEIDDIVTIFEHLDHRGGRFNRLLWFATKKLLSNPEILSINLDLIGSGGSGIGRVNINPYTGVVHYGSGLGS